MCIRSLDCVQLYCQLVKEPVLTCYIFVYVSQESDDLLVLVTDYYGPLCLLPITKAKL